MLQGTAYPRCMLRILCSTGRCVPHTSCAPPVPELSVIIHKKYCDYQMNKNPYHPPNTDIRVIEPMDKKRPTTVKIAVGIQVFCNLINIPDLVKTVQEKQTTYTIIMLIFMAILVGFSIAIYLGANWARWISAILYLLVALPTPLILRHYPSSISEYIYCSLVFLQGFGAILLFLPASSKWYKINN